VRILRHGQQASNCQIRADRVDPFVRGTPEPKYTKFIKIRAKLDATDPTGTWGPIHKKSYYKLRKNLG